MKLMVGCPAAARGWILPLWFEHIDAAAEEVGFEPHFSFVLPAWDEDTYEVIQKECSDARVAFLEEPERDDVRTWNLDRYEHMVRLRNMLLSQVRISAPELFWSVDSDILVARKSLYSAMEGLERFDAVGSKTFMTPDGVWAPSWGNLRGQNLLRQDADGLFSVDVIMAIKLMTPLAYKIDYIPHNQGEDVGWSVNCRRSGLTLGWDGRVCSKHVMGRHFLNQYDERCGY